MTFLHLHLPRHSGLDRAAPDGRRLRLPGGTPALARETVVVAGAMVTYFAVRNLTVGAAAAALDNARLVERFEAWAGIAWEHALQSLVVGSTTLVTLANWVYIWVPLARRARLGRRPLPARASRVPGAP